MKGWGPVSLSLGLLFPYPEKVEMKLKITFYQLFWSLNNIILEKKCVWKKHYHHYHHHHCCYHIHHHQHHHHHHDNYPHHHHSLLAPWWDPAWGPFGMKKTHYNHHHHHHHHHCHGFPSSRLVTVQDKLDFQLRRVSYLLRVDWKYCSFSKQRPSGPMLSISQNVRVSVCPCVHFWDTV